MFAFIDNIQIHCLDLIRQYTYFDYYSNPQHQGKSFRDSPETLRVHVGRYQNFALEFRNTGLYKTDHCIDMIRQALLCYGDTNVVAFDWMEGERLPIPNFSTRHKCRRIEPLMDYISSHLDGDEPEKPIDAVELPNTLRAQNHTSVGR